MLRLIAFKAHVSGSQVWMIILNGALARRDRAASSSA